MKFLIISLVSLYFGFALTGAPSYSCLVQWKDYNNELILPNGVYVGKSAEDKDIYIGKGTFTVDDVSQTSPGDIKAGDWLYVPLGSRIHITSGVEYLDVIGTCCEFITWGQTTFKSYVTVFDANSNYTFLISKHELSYTCEENPSGCDYVTVGSFLPDIAESYYSDKDGNVLQQVSGPFKIFACDVEVQEQPLELP